MCDRVDECVSKVSHLRGNVVFNVYLYEQRGHTWWEGVSY